MTQCNSTPVREETRNTGIPLIGTVPWGSHLCIFYETPADLIEANAAYLAAGLKDDEFCVWSLSDPVDRKRAEAGLRRAIPDFDACLSRGAIELLCGYQWYLVGDAFDPQRVTAGWQAKLEEALCRGFAGLRVSGNAFWMEKNCWESFRQYEDELNRVAADRRMLLMCTYSLQAARAVDVLDIAVSHHFTLARRRGRWEFLETPELRAAKREIEHLNNALDVMSKPFPGHDRLTPREQQTLAQIIRGASSKEAARALGVAPRTIEFHRANLMRKLGARNSAQLVALVFD
jgi:DNA-binding CsgD family transcriptional regulator